MIMAHEMGHIFGSAHDNATKLCTPGGSEGDYIMYASVSSGKKRNDYLFSPCSRQSVYRAIVTKGWNQYSGCFIDQYYPLCGNGIIDEGEECDCGYKGSCKDPCCTPAYQSFLDMTKAVPCRKIKDCQHSAVPAIVYVAAGIIGAVIMVIIAVMFWKQCIKNKPKSNHNALIDSQL